MKDINLIRSQIQTILSPNEEELKKIRGKAILNKKDVLKDVLKNKITTNIGHVKFNSFDKQAQQFNFGKLPTCFRASYKKIQQSNQENNDKVKNLKYRDSVDHDPKISKQNSVKFKGINNNDLKKYKNEPLEVEASTESFQDFLSNGASLNLPVLTNTKRNKVNKSAVFPRKLNFKFVT